MDAKRTERRRLWITYAWKDNEQSDVDFVVQELQRADIDVQIDRYTLSAGRRLWDQIGSKIASSDESDGWAIYATADSLASEPCREELAIALDRALRARGDSYPLIGIFPATITPDLVPPAIRVRLYVTLSDSNWVERVKAAVEGRLPAMQRPDIPPLFHRVFSTEKQLVVEVRPRVGRWYPCYVIVPIAESNTLAAAVVGPSGALPGASATSKSQYPSQDGRWQVTKLWHEATPTQSIYAVFNALPTTLGVGPSADAIYEIPLRT